MKKIEKLSRKDLESIVSDLVFALVSARTVEEASLFLQDILTKQELRNLAKRLAIAKLLINNNTYAEIEEKLHVSHGTVAKIAAWLSLKGDGFRNIIKKLPKKEKSREITDWDKLKRKHPMYFWPELLLEEIVVSANKKQKEKISKVLSSLEEKSDLHKKIESLIRRSKV